MKRGILYRRWSSLEQTGTTSSPRQLELTTAFAARNSIEIANPATDIIADEGLSAWTGENIRTGHLAKFMERMEREGGQDVVLIVEKLDRLSRQPAIVMLNWVQRLCLTGVTIRTADGRHTIDTNALLNDPMTVIAVIFEAFRANDESNAKSVRVGEAWEMKRERGAPMTRRCPAWLTIDGTVTCYKSPMNLTAVYRVIADRSDVVRRIFDLAASGIGKSTIARMLNDEGVPVFATAQGWQVSYVGKILANRAVIGEYQPCTKPKREKRTPVGDPIPNYFPAIVPLDQFEAVNDLRSMSTPVGFHASGAE